MNNKRGVLLGSLTSQSPTITRVYNGRKVDGLLQAGRAKLRVELVKREDCSAEFVCQVKGVDSQGREVVSTTNLVQQQSHDGHQVYDRNPMPVVSLQVLTLMQQLTQSINGLENRMEDKITSLGNNVKDEIASLENRMEDKISSLGVNVKYETSALENKLEDKISSMENKIEDMQKDITIFEYRLINKLDLLQNKLEKNIERNSYPNKVMHLDTKVSKTPKDFRSQAKTDIPEDTLDLMWQQFYREQKMALKNVSEYFKGNSNDTSALIAMEGDLDLLKSYGQMILNETETIRKVLTSDVPSRCVATQATDTPKLQPQLPQQPDSCLRDMGKYLNQSYPHYVTMTQFILQRQILCDTKTDGGGWIVIQRRINGNVYFNRDWESYKKGFGKPEPTEDFWLGNDAIYVLTYLQPYELRVEITSGDKDYVALYKTFKLEDETNKYRIRLGAVTSSIDDGKNAGLSYSNNQAFSTVDRDNDGLSGGHCAESRQCGWWFKACELSKLTGPWRNGEVYEAWYNGTRWMSATRTEMKIRTLQ
ncbi:ficolin-1 [Elysia marginata]|uniref:Ficolin-1 n=1 Tax=Elysia marginata TaxID=1093978 RepID=A0AAV4HN32_9GAST|nr:ficolin-1 [Elysia marginata]